MGASNNELKPVAGNALQSLTIIDWAQNLKGTPVSVQLTRQQPPKVQPTRAWRGEVLANGPPPRPSSRLPVPGSSDLTISLDKSIGQGRSASVYGVNTLRMIDRRNPSKKVFTPKAPYFPELVIKVAAPGRNQSLDNEAAMYDEMEPLQGVSIPRCYGLFSAELGPDVVIPSLSSVTDQNPSRMKVSVLLLERVGETLPLGDKLPEEGDLWDVFRDLARMGIEQPDIRYSDILQAPVSSSSFPGGVCPFHGITHHYRIIDFDTARKTDATLKRHYYHTAGYLGPILEGMKQKVIVEPWDISNADRPTAL